MRARHVKTRAQEGKTQAGVTLVELVVALILGAMVLLGLGYVFALNQGMWIGGRAKLAMHAEGTRALEEIALAAGHASLISIPGDGKLLLSFPSSPMGDPGRLPTTFSLGNHVLTRDQAPLVPSRGDTSIGVASFTAERMPLDENGVGILTLRLKLFSRSGLAASADTMVFETSIHARNQGLGLGSGPASSAAAVAPTGNFF